MSNYRESKKKRFVQCVAGGYDYIKKGEFYELTDHRNGRCYIFDKDGDDNDYGDDNFGNIRLTKFALGDHVLVRDRVQRPAKVVDIDVRRTGIKYRVQYTRSTDSRQTTDYFGESELMLIEDCIAKTGDEVMCRYNQRITSNEPLSIKIGKTYRVLDVRDTEASGVEFMVTNEEGLDTWYQAMRFQIVKKLPTTTTNKNSTEVQEETRNMANVTTAKTTGMAKIMDKIGVFGQVDNVAMTMTGKLAFLGEDGCFYSYENNVLVNNEDMVLDGFPMFAMPVARNTIKAGDLIIQKDGTYLFVNDNNKFINEKGEVITTTTSKHVMFGNAMDFVSKVMDFGMDFNMTGNTTDTNNTSPFGNPMVAAMMFGNMGSTGGKSDMFTNIMMMNAIQNMNGGQNTGNPMSNSMMPLMFMGMKDGNNDMMRNLFMVQMFNNQNKPAVVVQEPEVK